MDQLAYSAVTGAFRVITSVFFREIRTTGSHQVPETDPCIFIVAPHANQFIDPGLVLISNPRRFAPLMAESSFKRKIIGAGARLLKAIPVIRPQDLATKGKGTVRGTAGSARIIGTDTQFTQQIRPRDLLSVTKTLKLQVVNVISDTELEVKDPLNDEEAAALSSDAAFKVIPHVDQHSLYDRVHTRLAENGCIVIFPEGGSHDRSEMLPLKAGFAIMALGAMAEHENLNVKIVPVGLNYFHPHRFRSRAVVSYGTPISIDRSLVEKYKQGGAAKREAIAELLKDGQNGLRSVTVNAPNYETLMVIAAARRLYKPVASNKLSLDQVVELNRRFLLGYKYFENDPRLKELERKVQAYNDTLKYFGLRDHQVARTDANLFSATRLLISRLLRLICFAMIGFPAILLNSPIIVLALIISRRKQAEALAGSSVKIAARDVLATWKVLVAMVFGPAIYGFYTCLLFGYLYKNTSYDLKACTLISLAGYIAQPFIHYIGVRSVETGMDIYKSLKPLLIAVTDPSAGAQLRAMRDRLSDDITAFVNENGPSALQDFDPTKYSRTSKDINTTTPPSSSSSPSADAQGLFAEAPNLLHNWLGDDHSLFTFGGIGHSFYDEDSSSDTSSH